MAKECLLRPLRAYKQLVYTLWRRGQAGGWVNQSWPWWFASGIMVVPFTAQLWLLEWNLLFLVLLVLRFTWRKFAPYISVVMLIVAGLVWGSLWGQLILSASLPDELVGQDARVEGTVVSLPENRTHALRFRFRIESLEYAGQKKQFTGTVLLNWYQAWPDIKPGQRWNLKIRLKPAFGSLNPGAFNYAQWLFSQGIRATAYVRDSEQAVLLGTSSGRYSFERFRVKVQKFIEAQGLENRGVLSALATGVRTGISDAQWRVFRQTGTAHLVAISGLHIGLVSAMAYLVGFRLWRHTLLVTTQYPAQSVARLVSVLAAVFYAALAGFALPTTRALLMLLTYYGLLWFRRNPGRLFSLGLVLLLVLLIDPMAPLGGGFWLSFGAVFAIAQGTRYMSESQPASNSPGSGSGQGMKKRLALWWRVQWAVFLGLFPLTLFMFQQASLVSLPANIVAIPVVALLVVPLVLLGLIALILQIQFVAAGLLELADGLLVWLWKLLQFMSDSPFAVANLPVPQPWELVVAAAGFAVIFISAIGRARWLGLFGLLPLLLESEMTVHPGDYQLEVLDVGQGLAVVVRTRDHTLLYDAGVRYPSGFDAGSAIVLPFLRQQGIRKIHAVVASHDNIDHSGGLRAVLSEFPSAQRYSSAAFYPDSRACYAGQQWEWDGVIFSFLHPEAENSRAGNNQSCVLKIQGRYGSGLLSGDIERETEQQLLTKSTDKISDIDVLLVPHHGSRTSSTAAFINRVNPALAVVSAAYLNRFGHPHSMVVKRYSGRSIPFLNTADSGWINIRVAAEGIRATPYRAVFQRYWLGRKKVQVVDRVELPGHKHYVKSTLKN